MKNHFQRLGALLLILAVMLGTVPAAFAAQDGTFGDGRGGGFSRGNFADTSKRFLYEVKGYTAHDNGDLCAKSTESLHMAREWTRSGGFNTDVKYMCKCFRCGQMFDVYESDITRSYSEHVNSLPATGYGSDGGLYVSSFHKETAVNITSGRRWYYCSHTKETPGLPASLGTLDCGNPIVFRSADSSGVSYFWRIRTTYEFTCNIDGQYSFGAYSASCSGITSSGSTVSGKIETYSPLSGQQVKYTGDTITFNVSGIFSDPTFVRATLNAPEPQLKVIPLESMEKDFPSDSRPGGGGFNFHLGDDAGKLFSDNEMNIVLETDGIYYNPVTNTTYNMNDWTYDYSSRTYTVNLDNSTTSTVTYGDEYITIKEGDTIYNIYYYVAQDSEDTTCKHSYTSAVTTAATCEAPGLMTYTCSKCGDTYTEKIPATGHTWQVKQTVNTEYDENGNVTQQGYTVYKCATCGTEYKDEGGTGPPSTPGGGSGSDGNSIWDKLGNLVGSALGGIISIIEGVVSTFLDALISLVGMLVDKLNALVEGVMGIFQALPTIFSGFTGFLGATFAFLPEDLLMVLEFGFIAVIFVGLLTLIFRR